MHQYSQVLFSMAVLHHYIYVMRVATTQVQELALGFAEPHPLNVCLLQSIPPLWQCAACSKLAP